MTTPEPQERDVRIVEDVPGAFAELVADRARLAERTPWRIAFSGGSTARACYERLAARDDMAWEQIECFLGDERCVPPDDPNANQRLVREALGDRCEATTFFPMDCSQPAAYDALLAERPPLDLVHLGLGPDGHTASLFPGSPALESPPGRLVVPNHDPSGTNPFDRLTITFECLGFARMAVFTVAGASKREALARVLSGEDVPAARVRSAQVLWLVDPDALGDAADHLA